MDRHVLVDVVKDTAPMQVGGFVYPFHEGPLPKAEMEKRLGYQKDPKAAIQEAKKLMAAAGYARGSRTSTSWCGRPRELQAVGGGHPGHAEGEPQRRDEPPGRADLAVVRGGRRRQLRPRDQRDRLLAHGSVGLLHAWYGKGGPQNYSGWTNEEFHTLAHQIEREVDENKRKAMIRQAEAILENDPPLVPVA